MRLLNILYATLLVALPTANLLADHTSPLCSIAALEEETRSLMREVYYAPLNGNVKNAVRRFAYDVHNLDRCADSRPTDGNVADDHTSHGVPPHCYAFYSRVRQSFYPVERYLYDTNYDLPRVYYAYLEVRSAVYSLAR